MEDIRRDDGMMKQGSEFQTVLRIVDEISLFAKNEIFEVMVELFYKNKLL